MMRVSNTLGELLTTAETIKYLGIARASLNEWNRQRGLPIHHRTGQVRWHEWSDVEQWCASWCASR